jgi:hypothetical protein
MSIITRQAKQKTLSPKNHEKNLTRIGKTESQLFIENRLVLGLGVGFPLGSNKLLSARFLKLRFDDWRKNGPDQLSLARQTERIISEKAAKTPTNE